MNNKYVLDKLAREIARPKNLLLSKKALRNLLKEETLNPKDRFNIGHCIKDIGEKRQFYKNPKALMGDVCAYKMIYFGCLQGGYDAFSKIKHSPSEVIIAENPIKIIRVERFNDYVSLDIRDKELEEAEFSTKDDAHKNYISKHPEMKEVHCYQRQLQASSNLSNLEERLAYVKKFVESLL
jgi:hypothetical protein